MLLLNGTAHLGTGEVIQVSAIGIRNGKIDFVVNALTAKFDQSTYDTIINCEGKHVYPGFIATNSTLGLVEIDAVRASVDFVEVGNFNPHIRTVISFNTDSDITPTVRSNGVLIAQVSPRTGVISGTSSVVSLNARNWEDAIVRADDGIHLNWPGMYRRVRWGANAGEVQRNPDYSEQKEEIKTFLRESAAYCKTQHAEKHLPFEAMRNVFNGKAKVYVHCNFAREIEDVIALKKELDLIQVVLVGGHDAWMMADMINEQKISVMLHRVHDLPKRDEEDVFFTYRLPAILAEKGILFCLENSGDMETMNTRNLPFYAGTAVAYGLDKEKALQTITLNAAKILGIDDKYGSIEKGKDATLFVSTGDALDVRTNNVVFAAVHGEVVDLDNRQKQLYRKYMKMYGFPY